MKKTLIIIGAVLILLILGLWAFFFFTGGMPKSSDEVFGRFGLGDEAPVFVPPEDEEEDYGYVEDPAPTNSRKRLRQLSTRPVAGATLLGETVRFVERGTGHIYDIDTRGGAEVIVSGITEPRTIRAVLSPQGDAVALTSESNGIVHTVLGTLSNDGSGPGNLLLTALPNNEATEVGFGEDGNEFLFFVPDRNGGRGYAYNRTTEKTRELFNIPLSDVRILWGKETYVYTTPSQRAVGYIYKVTGNTLEYVTKGGRGLMAAHHASGTIVSTITNDDTLVTRDTQTGEVPLLSLFSEKCAEQSPSSRLLVCASPTELPQGYLYPDDWYKGIIGFSDRLLSVDSRDSSVLLLSNLEEESGRPLDVLHIGTNEAGSLIYFVNKYDNALWLLDLR